MGQDTVQTAGWTFAGGLDGQPQPVFFFFRRFTRGEVSGDNASIFCFAFVTGVPVLNIMKSTYVCET